MINISKLKSYLLNLEMIALLKPSDKLIINEQCQLNIDKSYYLAFFTRWYYNQSRDNAIDYLDTIILEINNIKIDLINDLNYELSNQLKLSLINSKVGLNNLQLTYQYDNLTLAKIQLILNRINQIIIDIDEIYCLKNIPINQIELIQENEGKIYLDTSKIDFIKTVDTNNNYIDNKSLVESPTDSLD